MIDACAGSGRRVFEISGRPMARPANNQDGSQLRHFPPDDLTEFITGKEGNYLVVHGGFGSVYRCTYRRENELVDVAVKAVRMQDDIDEEALWREIGIWKRLRHRSIVPLLGTTAHYSPVSIVSSWMPNGTLMSYLKKDQIKESLIMKYELLCNVADGLDYLHSESVVHGDLTSNNVLINENGKACLADFGLSSMIKPGSRFKYLRWNEKRPGALRWSAPELVNFGDAEGYVPSSSSDMYSYGCIIYEVLSGSIRSLSLSDILSGKTPERPDSEHMQDEDWIFVLQCWLSLPSLRPSASQALSFARIRLSVLSQDHANSSGTSKYAFEYSAHLHGAHICNHSPLVLPRQRPAFQDPVLCWISIDKLADALIAMFATNRYQCGLDDAIVLYHISLVTLVPNSGCIASSFDKISSAITKHVPDPNQHIISRVGEWYKKSSGSVAVDVLRQLQLALAYAKSIKHATFILEACEKSLELLQSRISVTHVITWTEPMEHLSTAIAIDAAAAALHQGDVNGAVELLEWGRVLLRIYTLQCQTSRKDEKWMNRVSAGHLRPSFSHLMKATRGGSIVMLIASRQSCDAVILSNAYPQALHVQLKISMDSLAGLSTAFQSCISSASGNSKSVEKELEDILRRLWVDVVEPVINRLKPEDALPESRIWWCPTSFFSTLPIHAAGKYTSKGERLSRLFVSSYTTSITSLLQAQRTCTDHPNAEFAAIYVSKPPQNDQEKKDEYPAIKSPGLEPDLVMSNLPASLRFRRYREVTRGDALQAFKDHGWFHLMAYALKTASESLYSSFLMHDSSLSISDIIGASVGPKEFAFLSPRPTGSRSSWMQNEVVQFAAGLQISGFKSMVGMMGDVGGFKVIDKFYNTLFRMESPDGTRAAQALHDTLEEMANSEAGLPLRTRVAFAHFGL